MVCRSAASSVLNLVMKPLYSNWQVSSKKQDHGLIDAQRYLLKTVPEKMVRYFHMSAAEAVEGSHPRHPNTYIVLLSAAGNQKRTWRILALSGKD